MKKKALILFILSLCAAAAAGSSPAGRAVSEDPLTLNYVANMGVLVGSGDAKVLIDALFDKPNPDYRAPAPETLDKMMKGAAPFDGIDLVLVTHNHPDHFDAALAVHFMEARSEPVLVAPEDAVEAMRQAAKDWRRIGPRVIAIDLKVGEKATRDVKGVPVTACRTRHSGDLDAPMNLMYIFEIDGRRVWHEGDPNGRCEIFQAFGLKDARLDLAVVHYWYPLEPNCARFLQEDLKAGHIALGHLPIRLEGDAPSKIDMVRQYYKDLLLLLPGIPSKVFQAETPTGPPKLSEKLSPLSLFAWPAVIAFSLYGDFAALKGPYLGQKPPGMTPEVFASGIISIVGYPYDVASS